MRPAVRAAFVPFNSPLEGVVRHMYLDVRGLVTTAIGVLIDPVPHAMTLPWLRADGSRATRDEIVAEWKRIRARQDWRKRGGKKYGEIALLHLDDAGLLAAVTSKLNEMDQYLARRFGPLWESWCADSQMGVLSISWGAGPAFRFPRFEAAARAGDWLLAAEECRLDEDGPDNIVGTDDDNPGVRPRNERNRVLFRNAAVVAKDGLDPSRLYWPRDLLTDATPTLPQLHADDEDTQTTTVPAMRPPPSHERVVIVRNNTEMIEELIKGRNANDDDPDAA
jgi:hypothetical protein